MQYSGRYANRRSYNRIGSVNHKAAMYRKPRQNTFAVFSIIIVVVMLISVMAVDGIGLSKKRAANANRIKEINAQIEAEYERQAQLKEYEKYTCTKKFVEETAKEKLGLVHEGEIIFKPND